MSTIRAVLDQYVHGSSVLWLRRENAVTEPHFSLEHLTELDDRLEARLDGLRIAESDCPDSAWEACQEELRWDRPEDLFPAATLAFASCDNQRVESVWQLASSSPEHFRAVESALIWQQPNHADKLIKRFFSTGEARQAHAALSACVVHQNDPMTTLTDGLNSHDPWLRARAIKATGELNRQDLLPQVKVHLGDRGEVGLSAAWAVSLLSRDETALAQLRSAVEKPLLDPRSVAQAALGRMRLGESREWLVRLIHELPEFKQSNLTRQPSDHRTRSIIQCVGYLGLVDFIPWLLDLMHPPCFARIAAESFTMITGLAIDRAPFEGEWPEGFVAGPTEDAEDESVGLDPDENLPWPNGQEISRWWKKVKKDFNPAQRHILGQPMSTAWLEEVLQNGHQRQRAVAAVELSIRCDRPLFQIDAPNWLQLDRLKELQ